MGWGVLLKVLIDCYHVNTRSSTAQIRKRLSQLARQLCILHITPNTIQIYTILRHGQQPKVGTESSSLTPTPSPYWSTIVAANPFIDTP
jgi:hypothetical protein